MALVLSTLLGLSACLSDAALRRLSPAEQAEFALYHHRLTGVQQHTYLAKASAAERTAYLRQLGLVQRFEALDPADRAAVLLAVHNYVLSTEPALRDRLVATDTVQLEPRLYRACVPRHRQGRWLCLFVSTDQRPPGITRERSESPNVELPGR